jgi:5'-nucleotidase
MSTERPLFILTNDDGIESKGLRVLEEAASEFADILTVAPKQQMSAVSHSISLHSILRIEQIDTNSYCVDEGTPTDCVYLAIHDLAPRRPTLILSGINQGLNVANDVIYSGTLAAAREGLLQGFPAMAFSMETSGDWPVHRVKEQISRILRDTLENGIPAGTLLNVNFPSPADGTAKGIRVTSLGRRYFSMETHKRVDPRGRDYLWIGGNRSEMDDIVGSDCNAVREGYISITPIQTDTTSHEHIATLESWALFKPESS